MLKGYSRELKDSTKDAVSDGQPKSFIVSQFTFLVSKAATQTRDITVWWRSEMPLILAAEM